MQKPLGAGQQNAVTERDGDHTEWTSKGRPHTRLKMSHTSHTGRNGGSTRSSLGSPGFKTNSPGDCPLQTPMRTHPAAKQTTLRHYLEEREQMPMTPSFAVLHVRLLEETKSLQVAEETRKGGTCWQEGSTAATRRLHGEAAGRARTVSFPGRKTPWTLQGPHTFGTDDPRNCPPNDSRASRWGSRGGTMHGPGDIVPKDAQSLRKGQGTKTVRENGAAGPWSVLMQETDMEAGQATSSWWLRSAFSLCPVPEDNGILDQAELPRK